MERDGVDGLTIRALSAQADVSPTSIYQHIGGKQAVCDALIDTYFTDLREQLIAIDESDPVLRLRRAGIIYREHALDAPGIYALVWMGQASDSAQHCLDAITQIIRYGQAASVFHTRVHPIRTAFRTTPHTRPRAGRPVVRLPARPADPRHSEVNELAPSDEGAQY